MASARRPAVSSAPHSERPIPEQSTAPISMPPSFDRAPTDGSVEPSLDTWVTSAYETLRALAAKVLASQATATPASTERVALLIRIAEGLHHAHLCGVLHRDLKPANILVDGSGNPRIIDFGVARWFGAAAAAEPGAADATAARGLTASGEVVGTVAYMSPEQAGAGPAGVDPRSDVYSLGLVAYEILAGRRARDLSLLPLPEALQRIVREEVPELPAVAGDRSQALAAIVRTAVARDPQERYGSAQAFAEDLRRFERGEPVAARLDHAVRRLRRALTRYRTAIFAACAAVLLLAVGLVAARAAQQRAERATAEARALAATLRDALLAVDPEANGRAPTALDVIAAAAQRLDEETPPGAVEDEVRSLLASAYARLGEHGAARDAWRRVLDLRRDLLGPTAEATLAAATALADQCTRTERVSEARDLIEHSVLRGRTFDEVAPLSLLDAEAVLAEAERIDNQIAAAVARLERITAVAKLRLGSADPRTVGCLRHLCRLYLDQGRWSDAERLLDAIRADLAGGDAGDMGQVHDLEALAIEHLLRHGRGAEAVPRAARLVEERVQFHGPDHRRALDAERYLGLALLQAKRLDEAIATLERVAAARSRDPGAGRAVRSDQVDLARALMLAGRFEDSERLLEAVVREADPSDHWQLVQPWILLGGIRSRTGRAAEALAALRESDRHGTAARGPDYYERYGALLEIGRIQFEQGDPAAAASLAEADRVAALSLEPAAFDRVVIRLYLALSYSAAGRAEEAVTCAEAVVAAAADPRLTAQARALLDQIAADRAAAPESDPAPSSQRGR